MVGTRHQRDRGRRAEAHVIGCVTFVFDDPDAVACTLPGGYRDETGAIHRDAAIALPTGHLEELVATQFASAPTPTLVTALLTGCVRQLGPYRPVTPDLVRGLLVADRTYLMLKLRQLIFGDRVALVLTCPICHRAMDVEFKIDQVPVEARRPSQGTEVVELTSAAWVNREDTVRRRVRFRLPTGADQEAIATTTPAVAEAQAVAVLLERCLAVQETDGTLQPVVGEIRAEARLEIERAMERVAPAVDLDLDVSCPDCGHAFVEPLDLTRLVLEEMKLGRTRLYREVHTLAWHYHWSESAILGLTRAKRRTYLGFVNDEARRSPAATG